jgi:hypothetical protein
VTPWKFYGEELTDEMIGDNVGFVYKIINHDTGKSYIGKKLFTKSKIYQKNKRKRRKRVESDWKTYTGSNKTLNEDVGNGHNIERIILHICKSKGWMSYYETFEILGNNAIQSDEFYNDWVSCKIRKSHLK